ncbi:MAG: HAMP domain-containing histidine kinase, partial [Devosiaceae bacterium]|nr:HAMP domain-containing histidine kinase [Devosiaceae bacterium MH13]
TLGLAQLERRDAIVRVDLAEAFLDTLAGVATPIVQSGAEGGELERLLDAAATFKPSLRNEAVALCCVRGGEPVGVASGSPADAGLASAGETLAALQAWLDEQTDLEAEAVASITIEEASKLLVVSAYDVGADEPLRIGAAFDVAPARSEFAALRRSALALDVVISILAALATFVIARRGLQPIDVLTRALNRGEEATAADLQTTGSPEVARLVDAVQAKATQDARAAALAETEAERAREAMLARLAAGLAHEVRNPVAGMSAAVSTLRRYGGDEQIRLQTTDLIERGLKSIDRVAASMLSTYRPPDSERDLLPEDLEDLKLLINPKTRTKQITLTYENGLEEAFPTSADAVRQIALNLLLNATEATPVGGQVSFEASVQGGNLFVQVADGGPGLPDEALQVLIDDNRDVQARSRRLGLWLVHQLIDDVGGRLSIASRSESGTTIAITIPPKASALAPDADGAETADG